MEGEESSAADVTDLETDLRRSPKYPYNLLLDPITRKQSIHAGVPGGGGAVYADLVDAPGGKVYARVSGGAGADDVSRAV